MLFMHLVKIMIRRHSVLQLTVFSLLKGRMDWICIWFGLGTQTLVVVSKFRVRDWI